MDILVDKEWFNCQETKNEGLNPSYVNKCCNNKQKKHKNYEWKFKYERPCGL